MVAEGHFLSQLPEPGVADGAVDVLGSLVVMVIAGRELERCEAGVQREVEKGLCGKAVEGVYGQAEGLHEGRPAGEVV